MSFKGVKVEVSDKKTRLVLKRIIGSDWECLNRKMAVTNQMRTYEQQRLQYKKSIFNSKFQTYHIRWDKAGYWDFFDMDVAKTEAQNNDRLFVAQRQMNEKLWKSLNKAQALNYFEELANKGLGIVTLNVPLKTNLEEWKKLKDDAKSILKGNQKLMPICSTRHDFALFPELINDMVSELQFVGIHSYCLTQPQEFLNLTALRKANSLAEEGKECPLIFGFNHSRHFSKYSYVNGSFALACFGIDIFSERQYFLENMPSIDIDKMMSRSPDEFMFYDTTQGGFNKGEDQEIWHEFNLTRETMRSISVEEGLNGYQALIWKNTLKQQEDLSILNEKLLNKKDVGQFIRDDKSKWSVFYATQVEPRL